MSLAAAQSPTQELLAAFEAAANTASKAEAAPRQQTETEIVRLERRRAFAYRRLNFMHSLSESVQSTDNEEAAIAAVRTKVRSQLGWESDSETRAETLSRLAPVTRATFCCMTSVAAV